MGSNAPPNALPSAPAGGFVSNVLPALVWTLAIFVGGSRGVSNPYVSMPFGFDKVQHLGAFFGLQVLSYRAFRYALPRFPVRTLSWWGSAASLFAGVALEVLQSGLPDRSADYQDVIADALGALLGVLTLWLISLSLGGRRPTLAG